MGSPVERCWTAPAQSCDSEAGRAISTGDWAHPKGVWRSAIFAMRRGKLVLSVSGR